MKFVSVLAAIAVTFTACGDESDPAGPTEIVDICAHEGEHCIRPGAYHEGPQDGQCRAYEDAPHSFACCDGCWDRELQYCQPGTVLGKCGVNGEDCAACE